MGFKKKFGRFFGFSSKEDKENNSAQQEMQAIEIQDEESQTVEEIVTAESVAKDFYQENTEEIIEATKEFAQETDLAQENTFETEEEPVAQPAQESSEEVLPDNAPDLNEAKTEPDAEEPLQEPQKKKGFFAKLKDGLAKTRDSINSKIDTVLKAFKKVDEELFEELEEALIMADVGVDTSLYIISELRKKVKENKITETDQVKGAIEEIIAELLMENDNSLNTSTSPCVIMVIGVNGVGKTTSIGKMASRFKSEGKKVILGAADTFRAAAIDQLQIWADRSGVDIIKHQEGSDPASVVFDTIAAAKSRDSDVIILDTAGRLHNKKNLMDELAKISRIIERELPDAAVETLLVLDATTGQNAVNQAKLFSETSNITGLILTKLDGSAKGGIVLAIAHEQQVPVKLVGVGEAIDDLQDFSAQDFAKALF